VGGFLPKRSVWRERGGIESHGMLMLGELHSLAAKLHAMQQLHHLCLWRLLNLRRWGFPLVVRCRLVRWLQLGRGVRVEWQRCPQRLRWLRWRR